MKYLILSIIVMVSLTACGNDDAQLSSNGANKTVEREKLIYYTCPTETHKYIHARVPGECPECNMTLLPGVTTTEAKKEYYGCPMLIHSHVRHESRGRCEECNMALKPMRLIHDA